MFNTAWERLFRHEGGFQNNPNDRGNWTSGSIGRGKLRGTKYGISAMSYPRLDIENLTLQRAKRIYRKDWWDKLYIDCFPKVLQFQMMDAAVNHGMYNAVLFVQRAVNVKADGVIGPITEKALVRMDHNDLLLRFLAERLCFMTHLKSWNIHSKGWARRISHNLIAASKDN